MIIDLFVVLFIVAFILSILAVEAEDNIAYHMLGLIFWLVLFVQSLYLLDISGTIHYEYGISALCLGFIFLHILMLFLAFLEWKFKRGGVVT